MFSGQGRVNSHLQQQSLERTVAWPGPRTGFGRGVFLLLAKRTVTKEYGQHRVGATHRILRSR